jgi:hypothetical protein
MKALKISLGCIIAAMIIYLLIPSAFYEIRNSNPDP